MSKPKVLIFARREEPPETIKALEDLGCEIVFGKYDWQLPRAGNMEDEVVEAARDAVALMGTSIRHTPITRRILQASQRLRLVAKYTVGVDDIDTEAATDLGVMVCHAPTESNCFGVAETTVTFMLALFKKLRERDADVRAGKWRELHNFAYYVGSRASDGFPGQTIGLVGLGRIGTRVAQLLAPWRARIIAYDPYVPPAHFLTHGVQAVVPEIAGPIYTRHEANGTRQVTAEEYRDALAGNLSNAVVEDLRYRLIAEDDRVVAIGTWKIDGQQWDWVQAFRVEGGKLVETWLSGINFDGQWGPDVLH